MATACERLDILVKDYLLFRGFTATVKAYDHELKHDKDKGLRADRILEQLLAYVGTYDLQHLRDNWAYLNQRFFSRLEQRYAQSVRRLEISLLKLYVVNAQQNNRQDRVRDFFEKMGPELHNQQEFRDWFAFPFLANPAENSTFSLYFTKQWQETLQLSLHNFLQVVLQAMPVPTLLNFDHDYRQMVALQEENEILKAQFHSAGVQEQLLHTSFTLDYDLHSGGPVIDKRVSHMKTSNSKDSSPQPLPDLIYDFSGLAEEIEAVSEKQKPTRRFPINLSTPLLKRKQEPRPEKGKSSGSRVGGPHQNQLSNQSSNNSSQQNPQLRPSRPSFTTPVSATGMSAARVSSASFTIPPATGSAATAGTFSATSVAGGPRGVISRRVSDTSQPSGTSGPQQQSTDKSMVAGLRGKVARELTSFPPYTSPQSERTDLLPAHSQVASTGGDTEKKDVAAEQLSTSGGAGPSEQGSAQDSFPTGAFLEAQPLECADVEKLQELQTGDQCPFLMLSEDDYLEHQSAVCYSRFSATGQCIASLDADGVVKVWTWSPQPSTTATVMSRAPFLSLDWASKSDRWLLLGNKSGQIRLFDTREIKTFREASVEPPHTRVMYLSTCQSTMTFASCQAVASPAPDAAIEMGCLAQWDLRTMKLERNLTTESIPVASTCCIHNMNGKQILAGGVDGILRLYDVGQKHCVMKWPAHRGSVTSLQFGHQESSCVSMGSDGKLCEWSLTQNGHPLRQIVMQVESVKQAGHPAIVTQMPQGQSFCLNKDKTYLLSSTANHGIVCKMCDSNNRPSLPHIMDLSEHGDVVTTVDWSPSVETPVCLTGAHDGCLKVYTLLSQ